MKHLDKHSLQSLKAGNVKSLREIVVESLRDAIVSGKFKPGDHLRERELSEIMSVSTTPIKEAFRILGHEGLVETIPRRGTFVSELADTSIEELQILRASVEGLCARFAAIKITDEKLSDLKKQIGIMESLIKQDGKSKKLVEENTKFHRQIRDAGNNPMIAKILTNISSFDKAFRKRALQVDKEVKEGYSEHRGIFEAIEARNPELAEERMKQHILRTLNHVLKTTIKNKGEYDGSI